MKKARIAIIGATGTAHKRTIPALSTSEVCEVVAIQGRNLEKVHLVGNQFGIPQRFADVPAMLSEVKPDVAYIASPPFMHAEELTQCLTRGIPTVCEKPIAVDGRSGAEIKRIAEQCDSVPVMVAHHARHQQAVFDIRQLVGSGVLGRITHVWCQWAFQLNENASNAAWKLDPKLGGGGTFRDNGIHIIDLMLHLFGVPDYVFGHCNHVRFRQVNDNEMAVLVYQGFSACLHASQSTQYSGNHLLIYGERGKIEGCRSVGEHSIRDIKVETESGIEQRTYDEVNLYGREVEDFVRYHILKTSSSLVGATLDEALLALDLIDRIRESSTGRQVIPT